MNAVRRMSAKDARLAAHKLASEFLDQTAKNSYIGQLLEPAPDATRIERVGKVPRHWVVPVEWTLNGNVADGPSVILVDVIEETTDWL